MYKIKANGNFHVVLKDIGVYFSYPQEVLISEEKYNKSKHIQILLNHGTITVEKIEVNNTSSSSNSNSNLISNQENTNQDAIFVAEGNTGINNDGAFIRSVDTEYSNNNIQEVQHNDFASDNVAVEIPSIDEEVSNFTESEEQNVEEVKETTIDESVLEDNQVELLDNDFVDENSSSELSEIQSFDSATEEKETKTKSFVKKRFNKKK